MSRSLISLLAALALTILLATPVLAYNSTSAPLLNSGNYQEGGQIEVATQGATSITNSSATLNGYLGSLGPYTTVVVSFELSNGSSVSGPAMSAPGPFSAHIGGLAPGTSYQFRAVAMAPLMGGQKVEGAFVSFNTIPSIPQAPIEVSTSSASDVTSGAATLRGYLSNMGPYTAVKVWFEYGSSTAYGNNTGEQIMNGPGPFGLQVSGLSPNMTYYFRAVAQPTVIGVSAVRGNSASFTTPGGNIAVSTGAETNITATSATVIGYLQSLGTYRSVNVWFEWGTTTSYGQVTPMQTMYSTGVFNYTLQGLAPGTTYHFRALAVPGGGEGVAVRGFDSVFTTAFSPGVKVSTGAASSITAKSTTFNGYLTSMGSSSTVNVWFEYGTDPTFGSSTPQQMLGAPGNFSYNVTTLRPGTTYYYRAAAFSNGNSVYGQYSTFQTTTASPVSISTNAASSISTTAATLNAYVNSLGNVRSIQVWFDYGRTPDYGNTTVLQTLTSAGTVSVEISGLTPGTDYYFQAVAQAPDGTKSYGSQDIFTTVSNSKIAVTTSPATGITNSHATLNGNLDDLGNTSMVQVWFEYGNTTEYGNSTGMQARNSPGSFSSTITGLNPGTTYYYRAAALNPVAGGRSVHGASSSFVTSTSPAPPTPPSPSIPIFVWFIGGLFIFVILILIIILLTRR